MGKQTSLFVATALLLLSLCACIPAPRAVSGLSTRPDPALLLASIEERKNSVRDFRGIGRLSLAVNGKKQSSRAVWIGSRPARLRVETLGVWGQPNLTFLVRQNTFWLYIHQEHQCLKGKATAHNLSRLVSISLGVEDLFALLSGQVPFVSYDYVKLGHSRQRNRWSLNLYKKWRRLVERIWLDDEIQRVREVEVFDGWGHLQYKVIFDGFQDINGTAIPKDIIATDDGGKVLSLSIERFWLGVEIPDEAYTPQFLCTQVTRLDS